MSGNDDVDIKGVIVRETSMAIHFLPADDPDGDPTWLSRSQIAIVQAKDNYVVVTLPEWLAIKKELW